VSAGSRAVGPPPLRDASLEALLEDGSLELSVFHPGGLDITRQLAERCNIGPGRTVLDVASGTGAAARHLARTFRCRVVAVDRSAELTRRARLEQDPAAPGVMLVRGDAHRLPLHDSVFDAVLSECSLCALNQRAALGEMARVARPGGYVGIHDLCWAGDAPESLKGSLASIEREEPNSLPGWVSLFREAGLSEVVAIDRSSLLDEWVRGTRTRLGPIRYAGLLFRILRRWGVRGLRRILESERVFRSPHLGYGMIVGRA
jgi:SAM-dependent methyltransferase